MTREKIYKTMQTGILAIGLSGMPVYAAHAAAGVKVGVLTCHEASGWGSVVESTRDLKCVFSPSSGPSVHYTGHISKFGVDIGYQGASVIIWTVLAPALNMSPDDLAGNYVGATGGASVGIGASANVLVGGSNKSVSLQPVSFSRAIPALTWRPASARSRFSISRNNNPGTVSSSYRFFRASITTRRFLCLIAGESDCRPRRGWGLLGNVSA